MQKTASGKLVSLEICRFVAAFCVMIDHQVSFLAAQYPRAPRPLLGGLDLPPITPVLFFFVLSGFVMVTAHHQDFGRSRGWARFAWRRFCRIYPVYWLSLAIYLYFLWPVLPWHEIVRDITLSPFQPNLPELNPPAWSLRFEIAFYVMFCLALLPRIGRFILAGWIAVVAWHWLPRFFPHRFGVQHPFPARIDWHFFGVHEFWFFAGLLAGFCFIRYRWPRPLYWVLLAAGLLWLVIFSARAKWGFDYPAVPDIPLAALALAAVILSLSALERAGSLRPGAGWRHLGTLSYPLYLFHSPVLFAVGLLFYRHAGLRGDFAPAELFVLLLAVTLALTAAVTFAIDQPLQRILRGRRK